ncbi:hypothetical protein Pla108_22660 [Botrimarina colliarenosi]|uniref:Uncharacterized protein n=1 Tax=Botrimarina colliarenosi TaxID=2528001 RepID=A0A5C6AES3_9BACT|nr:hypothetical protein [Botrimarina colliarenosi]TWT98109.1 hypothetical protein Pla108_22660 [Botrimarina colliarenosi]
MSAYRYVVFHPGAPPTAEELGALRRYAELLNNHIAWGTHRHNGALAIACEAEPFDRLRGIDPAFEELLLQWQARGGHVAEKLPFVKDSKAWRTMEKPADTKAPPRAPASDAAPSASNRQNELKPPDAREAVGRVRIKAAKITAQAERIERAAGWTPYVLWGLGAALVLGAGFYLGSRLLAAGGERRSATVERIADDPIGQSLAPEPPE